MILLGIYVTGVVVLSLFLRGKYEYWESDINSAAIYCWPLIVAFFVLFALPLFLLLALSNGVRWIITKPDERKRVW